MRSTLFWKLLLVYLVLVLVSLSICTSIILQWQRERIVNQVYHRLQASAVPLQETLLDDLGAEPSANLQATVRQWGELTNIRYTVVNSNGRVLADSAFEEFTEVIRMENHLNRQEIVQAARQGQARSRRNSPTLGFDSLYYAMALQDDDEVIGFVRTSQPFTVVKQQLSSLRWQIWQIGLSVTGIGLLVFLWFFRRMARSLRALTNASERIAVGEYPFHIGDRSQDELGSLVRSFERMSRELKSRETKLRETLERQMTVLSGMVEGVIAVDGRQHILFANAAAGRTMAFAPERVVGLALLEVIRSHELSEIVSKALNERKLCQGEIEWQSKSSLILEVHATPLPGAPCPGIVLVLHDVTELKRLESLRQQFVANVSHELKTPLSSIKAYTETLLNGAVEDREVAQKFLSRIDNQTDRLHELILDLLSIARIESGQATLELTDISVEQVISACLASHEERARVADLTLKNEVVGSNLKVCADEESLLQILSNLVDNAIKYTPPGGEVTVRVRSVEQKAILEVADTGIGIAPEHHSRLFERFYRVDKARSRELGGTGLGLAIVKHLCQAMHGSVAVESIPGKGSVFSITLPLAQHQQISTTAT